MSAQSSLAVFVRLWHRARRNDSQYGPGSASALRCSERSRLVFASGGLANVGQRDSSPLSAAHYGSPKRCARTADCARTHKSREIIHKSSLAGTISSSRLSPFPSSFSAIRLSPSSQTSSSSDHRPRSPHQRVYTHAPSYSRALHALGTSTGSASCFFLHRSFKELDSTDSILAALGDDLEVVRNPDEHPRRELNLPFPSSTYPMEAAGGWPMKPQAEQLLQSHMSSQSAEPSSEQDSGLVLVRTCVRRVNRHDYR